MLQEIKSVLDSVIALFEMKKYWIIPKKHIIHINGKHLKNKTGKSILITFFFSKLLPTILKLSVCLSLKSVDIIQHVSIIPSVSAKGGGLHFGMQSTLDFEKQAVQVSINHADLRI